MQVILLEDVRGLGKRYEVKNVASGYARNFLFPRRFAAPAKGDALKLKAEYEKREQNRAAEIQKKTEELRGTTIAFTLKAGERGEVFGSVRPKDIEKALKEKGFGDAAIECEPLRSIGEQMVTAHLGGGVTVLLKVVIEAQS